MTAIAMQRDLVLNLKKETCLNLGILDKVHPMSKELSRQVFKEDALQKPTQNVFNNLSFYLVSIIDPQKSASLPWPLYDTKTERAYRNVISSFITECSSKGLVAPVMSSYLVNPGCYKVTLLVFQLSQLAVQRALKSLMTKDSQKKLFDDMTDKYKSQNKEEFMENIKRETDATQSKFSNYLYKREAMEKIAGKFRVKIIEMEAKVADAQKYISNIIDNYISLHAEDVATRTELLKIKDVSKMPQFFEQWLLETDAQIDKLETGWNNRVSPFLQICRETLENTEALIARQTGGIDKNSFMIEYNPNTDNICTKDLQEQVNSQQRYILKNIVKDDKLNFPNLIRSFLISICFILKNTEIEDEIYKFNEYLNDAHANYTEIVLAMRNLITKVMTADAKLQPSQQHISVQDFTEIPVIPDLSDLKMNRDHYQILFDTFTPLNTSKHQFNLLRKQNLTLKKPKLQTITPFHQRPNDDFLKSLISCRISSYDRSNESQNINNISIISQATGRNETIAECSGFTKQQIMRLLSTKKTSSSKKFKYSTERPEIKVKKGGLFNESNVTNESHGLFRSHSSPNLFEKTEKTSLSRRRRRMLSIMQEDSLLEVSGIAALERESRFSSPQEDNMENCRKMDTTSLPVINIGYESERKINNILNDLEVDFNTEIKNGCRETKAVKELRDSLEKQDKKTETPKTSSDIVRKTSSIEKIINRFKKVRANVMLEKQNEKLNDFRTIVEEKDSPLSAVNVDVFTANRILLPDLLSPSCSGFLKPTDYTEQLCLDMDERDYRKPRESLGTALGVDHTFLDQFDLID